MRYAYLALKTCQVKNIYCQNKPFPFVIIRSREQTEISLIKAQRLKLGIIVTRYISNCATLRLISIYSIEATQSKENIFSTRRPVYLVICRLKFLTNMENYSKLHRHYRYDLKWNTSKFWTHMQNDRAQKDQGSNVWRIMEGVNRNERPQKVCDDVKNLRRSILMGAEPPQKCFMHD